MTRGTPQWARARQEVGAAREAVARLALDAERIERSEGRSLATALREAVVAIGAAEERIAVAALRARRVAAAVETRLTPTGREGTRCRLTGDDPFRTRGMGDRPWDPGRERASGGA